MAKEKIEQTAPVETTSMWIDTASFTVSGKQAATYSDLDLARCRRILDSAKNELIMDLKLRATNSLTTQTLLNYYGLSTLASLPLSYSGLSEIISVLQELADKYGHEFDITITDVLSHEN